MRQSRRGFTLIELLVVVVIIALLAALILPVLRSHRAKAHRSACASNLNQLGKALFMYCDVPASGIYPSRSTTTDPYADPRPMEALHLLYGGYIANPKIYSCPSSPIPRTVLQSLPTTNGGRLPPGTRLSAASCSYGYDPGHSPNDAITAIAADRPGTGSNSDNHGSNQGQNVLLPNGTVEFQDSPINDFGEAGEDSNIFELGGFTGPAAIMKWQWRDFDSHIRQ